MKTVASCPKSLETTKQGTAWGNEVNLLGFGHGSDFYQEKWRTSPKHKRPLDNDDELEDESVGIGISREGGSWSRTNTLTAEPRKRSKVDVR